MEDALLALAWLRTARPGEILILSDGYVGLRMEADGAVVVLPKYEHLTVGKESPIGGPA